MAHTDQAEDLAATIRALAEEWGFVAIETCPEYRENDEIPTWHVRSRGMGDTQQFCDFRHAEGEDLDTTLRRALSEHCDGNGSSD